MPGRKEKYLAYVQSKVAGFFPHESINSIPNILFLISSGPTSNTMLLLKISQFLVSFLILCLNCTAEITEIKHCNEFTCTDGTCMPANVICDGIFDCSDASDEIQCHSEIDDHDCAEPSWFRCPGGRCISTLFVCDGHKDCPNFDDERNCTKSTKDEVHDCAEHEFTCVKTRACISKSWMCDGEPDCEDGSDETAGCHESVFPCTGGFRCDNKHCILKEFRCDGDNDCGDNSDEHSCVENFHDPTQCFPENSLFLCHDKVLCLELRHVCDNAHHCFDESDELGCNAFNSTACTSANCSHECRVTPDGPRCLCPVGHRLDKTLKTCEDVDECSIFGFCSQRCRNSIGGFECSCDEGYQLQPDRKTCKAKGGEALLLFASGSKIRGFYLESQLYFSVVNDSQQVTAVSHNGHQVYWTNIYEGEEMIIRSNEDGSDREIVVDAGLGLPEDLEVDYVTGNIYFTDSDKRHIGVCSTDGIHCTVLVNEDVDKPRAIALLPRRGVMFWSDWGKHPMIASSGMDGSNPRPFVEKDIHWPNGLALDFSNDRLYWVDAKLHSISTVRLDGSERKDVLKYSEAHPFAISVFEDYLYWSDWMGSEVQRCNKFNGKNFTTLFKENDHKNIFGVHIYHSLLHPRIMNPCATAPCDGLCLLAPNNSYSCACAEDAELDSNNRTCHHRPKRVEVVLVNDNTIHLVTRALLGKQQYPQQIQSPDIEKISAIAYNSLTDSVLLSDWSQRKIFEFQLQTRRMVAVLTSGVGKITSMSHDPYTNNLYACDEEKRTLDVWSLHTKTRKTLIKYSSGHRAVSVVVAADQRLIFVAVTWPNEEIQINKISINGSGTMNVLIATNILGLPVHMALDSVHLNLHWYNSFFKAVEFSRIDGTKRNVTHILPGEGAGLAVANSTIFWTVQNTPRLYYWNPESGERFISIDIPWGKSLLMTSLTQPSNASHPCQFKSNGGCSHICLASTYEASCVCSDGFHLLNDGKTCVNEIACTDQQFRCSRDSICISRILRCDGSKDCPKGEDEEDCEFDVCKNDQFRCGNGQCVAQSKKCDFNFDCADRSDEINCINKCKEGFFPCGSGECISEIWACDGDRDCLDGSDENACGEITCDPNKFMCKSGTCISKHWECDGDMDCMDGSDEHDQCRPKQCNFNEWKCKNKQCIEKDLKCNGFNDCGDNSDESDCKNEEVTDCRHDEFLCSTLHPICVPNSSRCNFTAECPLGEDETDCARCHRGEFQCKNQRCVSNRWVCDGENDCGDNSDEVVGHCDASTRFGETRNLPCDGFRCLSGECLPLYMVCNGERNCADGSDEGGRCKTSCSEAVCQGICVATPTEAICQCREGFLLASDGHSCIDIDECLEDRCTQNCVNTPGSFVCTCSDDYVLKNDRVTCKAKGDRMSYVIGTDDEVKKIGADLNHVDLVLYEPGNSILGADIDSRKKVLYWTSGTTNTLNIYKVEDGSRSFMSEVGRPGKLSLDWVTGNLFFIDKSSPNMISACHIVDRKCVVILKIEEGAIISNLVFDPIRGLLFYAKTIPSGLKKPYSKIFKYDIARQNVTLLASHDVTLVSGMVVDPIRLDLYWSDLHQQCIERIRYDGSDRKIVFKHDVRRPEGLSLFEDSLFWLSKGSGELTKCDIYGEHKGACVTMSLHIYDANFLIVHHEAKQPMIPNPCSNISCDSFSMCVITSEGGRCVCEDGTLPSESSGCSNNHPDVVLARARISDLDAGPEFQSHYYNGTSMFLAVFLTMLVMIALLAGFIYMKSTRKMPTVLGSFHFRNPTFGVSHVEGDMHHRLLSPGPHDFINPTAFVKHPNGDIGLMTSEQGDGCRRVIHFQDCESDGSEHYEEIVDLKAQLIT